MGTVVAMDSGRLVFVCVFVYFGVLIYPVIGSQRCSGCVMYRLSQNPLVQAACCVHGPLAQVLVSLGVERGMVVYGMDKLDEISMSCETKICEMTDCDELQMLNFAILGLRSDMDNYRQNSAMSEQEIELLDGKLDELMATWNGKWAALDCEQDMTDDELDTSGEEIGDYPE